MGYAAELCSQSVVFQFKAVYLKGYSDQLYFSVVCLSKFIYKLVYGFAYL